MRLIAAPPGTGKTTAAARFVAEAGSAVWLADRHEDVQAAAELIEEAGGIVGRPLPLRGETNGRPNCEHPDVIEAWQAKGYDYRRGFCCHVGRQGPCCQRRGDAAECPYLASIDAMREAPIACATKAFARNPRFFFSRHHRNRRVIVLDEDPIGLLRPDVLLGRQELGDFSQAADHIAALCRRDQNLDGFGEATWAKRSAEWAWRQTTQQELALGPVPICVPHDIGGATTHDRRVGQTAVENRLHWMMRCNPTTTVRNVYHELLLLVRHAAAGTVFVTSETVLFHVEVPLPPDPEVIVLDATGSAELLRPVVAPRGVEVCCDERVRPAGRVIQFMDFNGPRSYLNKIPGKAVQILNAVGDLHPRGTIVLISHCSCVEGLRRASSHASRIRTAYFGALRGRNDLEESPANPIACHVVMGSPKTTEEDRRRLALAVYGREAVPFPELVGVRRGVRGRVPWELAANPDQAEEAVWEVRLRGYHDPRMQAIYDGTVTAELTHAADRARVLIHPRACVYLVTNEPCPRLWFAEMCYADDYLDLGRERRSDFAQHYRSYEGTAFELLKGERPVCNADICRALGRKPTWGSRYWREFMRRHSDALVGERKVRWKTDEEC